MIYNNYKQCFDVLRFQQYLHIIMWDVEASRLLNIKVNKIHRIWPVNKYKALVSSIKILTSCCRHTNVIFHFILALSKLDENFCYLRVTQQV